MLCLWLFHTVLKCCKFPKPDVQDCSVTGLVSTVALNTKSADIYNKMPYITNLKIENKLPDTTIFITTSIWNTLTKIKFDPRMAELTKNVATKKEIKTPLDLGYKNREKNKELQIMIVWI